MRFIDTLRALPPSRRFILAGAVAAVVAAMTLLVRGAAQDPMALLYSGLDPAYAGEIINELDQLGTRYEIKGDAIFIASGQRDAVRFALARQGLPRQSVQGYELLDNVNGFSVTSEMYNATYWRAKEGELTRTILAIPGVSAARVHIGVSLQSGFVRSRPANTASVTLSTTYQLADRQAQAIQYLVALAVAGLSPEEVAVIDTERGVLAGPGNPSHLHEPSALADTKAQELEQNILRLLEARLGAGNARVSVAVEVNRDLERVSSVVFDPDSRVIRQRTVKEGREASTGSPGALTVASNLPQTEDRGAGGSSSNLENSTESVSYEVNETRTETERLPGKVERLSVAVLLNEVAFNLDPAAPNVAEQLERINAEFQALIASAAGLRTDRGDVLTVELMPFSQPEISELEPEPSLMQQLIERHFWQAIQVAILGLMTLALVFGVIRPMLMRQPASADKEAEDDQSPQPKPTDDKPADPFDYLRDYTRERADETAALLREWLEDEPSDQGRKAAVNE